MVRILFTVHHCMLLQHIRNNIDLVLTSKEQPFRTKENTTSDCSLYLSVLSYYDAKTGEQKLGLSLIGVCIVHKNSGPIS